MYKRQRKPRGARSRAPANTAAQSRQPAHRVTKTDAIASVPLPSASARGATPGPKKPLASTNPPIDKSRRSYAQTFSGHSASKTVPDDYQVVKDFLAEFDVRKVAQTFRSIRSRLETADITERFMLLVKAATCVGLLRVGSSNETSPFFPGTPTGWLTRSRNSTNYWPDSNAM